MALPIPALPATASAGLASVAGLAGIVDVVYILGQSNNCGPASSATTPFSAAGIWRYSQRLATGYTSFASQASVGYYTNTGSWNIQAPAQVGGGNFGELANGYTASSGRKLLFVPCANTGSALLASSLSTALAYNIWTPTFPRGRKLPNSLYGNALAARNDIHNNSGLTINRELIWWYNGETDAGNPTQATRLTYGAQLQSLINATRADWGFTLPWVCQKIKNTISGATAQGVIDINAQIASVASSTVLVLSNPNLGTEPDGIHDNNVNANAIGVAAAAAIVAAGAPFI